MKTIFFSLTTTVFIILVHHVAVSQSNKGIKNDFNGDGASDLALYDGINHWKIALANKNKDGFTHNISSLNSWDTDWNLDFPKQFLLSGDFNGDGKTDIGAYDGQHSWRFFLSTGDGFSVNVTSSQSWNTEWDLAWDKQFIFTGDFNGDGKTDIGGYNGVEDWRIALSTGNGFNISAAWVVKLNLNWDKQFIFTGDFNGDGKTDIGGYNGVEDWRFALSTGSSINTEIVYVNKYDIAWDKQFIFTGDFNGDGKTDIGGYNGVEDWRFFEPRFNYQGNNFNVGENGNVRVIKWNPNCNKCFILTGNFASKPGEEIAVYNGKSNWNFYIGQTDLLDSQTANNKLNSVWTTSFKRPVTFSNDYLGDGSKTIQYVLK